MDYNILDFLQSDEFNAFLKIDATTSDGRNAVAKYFEVDEEWENAKSNATPVEQYYELLYLVKTKSTKDTLWISFIEGLHRHAAMVMSLLCSSFDLENNSINLGSLTMENFKRANFQHFKWNEHSPLQQLNDIMTRQFQAPMMTSTFTVQAYVPKKIGESNIDKLMKTLSQHSSWISINKTESARKSISRLLLDGLVDTINWGTGEGNTRGTSAVNEFTYLVQTGDSADEFKKKTKNPNNNDECYGYSLCTRGNKWEHFITNPFNKEATETYLEYISPKVKPNTKKKPKIRPPFKIHFSSMTSDIGQFDPLNTKEPKRRYIDARHYNMYVIMPKMVYLLSSTLRKEALHKRLGNQCEMDIINFILRFGYGTRSGPFLTLHGAYTKYTSLTNMKYINNCEDKDRIITK